MKVEIQSKNLIKPSFSTPSTLRRYKISFIDEIAPKTYVPLVLFFPPSINYDDSRSISKLQKSLEKTLTLMYPLAGRYIEDIREVDCNDQGVEFIQARVDITIEEILHLKVDPKVINEFLPLKFWSTFEATDPVLAIQVTIFQCGGLALGVNMSHRIGDAATLTTFLTQWATFSRRDPKVETVANSNFPMPSLFPSRGLSPFEVHFANSESKNNDYVTIKLSFNVYAISNMRAKATLGGKINTHHLSKVQLVSALLWKAFIGVDHAIYGHPKHSALVQPIDLRHETISLITKNAFGNLWGLIVTSSCDTNETKKGFEELTTLLVDNFKKTTEEYSKVGQDNHEMKKMILESFSHFTNVPNSTELIWSTSWCKFPFYGVNFGFGKPVWISFGFGPFKRSIILLDDAGGDGVEAYVNMRATHAPSFLQDEDIMAFASKQRTKL